MGSSHASRCWYAVATQVAAAAADRRLSYGATRTELAALAVLGVEESAAAATLATTGAFAQRDQPRCEHAPHRPTCRGVESPKLGLDSAQFWRGDPDFSAELGAEFIDRRTRLDVWGLTLPRHAHTLNRRWRCAAAWRHNMVDAWLMRGLGFFAVAPG